MQIFRLCGISRDIGLLPDRLHQLFEEKKPKIWKGSSSASVVKPKNGIKLEQLLKRNDSRHEDLPQPAGGVSMEVAEQVEITVKYAGYIERQESDVDSSKKWRTKRFQLWVDYDEIPGVAKRITPETKGNTTGNSGFGVENLRH
ncbi:MAG: hypothetical protein CM1200mP29_11780 [Verrucomicrobiota bacterium]|nr:MAG: hypothetical protein CM1200mP29_11780 [Verrucomicrobiota bacterium]